YFVSIGRTGVMAGHPALSSARPQRAAYLQQVAAILRDKAPLGDGTVHRVCRGRPRVLPRSSRGVTVQPNSVAPGVARYSFFSIRPKCDGGHRLLFRPALPCRIGSNEQTFGANGQILGRDQSD